MVAFILIETLRLPNVRNTENPDKAALSVKVKKKNLPNALSIPIWEGW